MVAGARLGDDALLAHPARHEDLAHGVVDLVGARVVEVLALEVDGRAVALREPPRPVERARAAYVVAQQGAILLLEILALQNGQIGLLQVGHALVQDLGDIGAAELAVITFLIY